MNLSSENINELAGALSKAQGEITCAIKDGMNPHFKSKYATLSSVWEACREPLSKHGLAVVQTTQPENDQLIMVTTLMHSSGQWIKSLMPVIAMKSTPQAIGSATTYARRYSLASMVGVAPDDDDDANEAQSGNYEQKRESKPIPFVLKAQEKVKPAIITPEQSVELATIVSQCSPDYIQCVKNFINGAGIESIKHIPVDTYPKLLNAAVAKKNEYAHILAEMNRLDSMTSQEISEAVNE